MAQTLRVPAPLRWRSSAASDVGRLRAVNEDAYLERPQHGLWAIADGMGGHYDGARASREIVTALRAVTRPRLLGAGARRICSILERVNGRLLAHARRRGQDVVGSTVLVFLAVGRYGALLWAGDSRAYRLRGDDFVQLTTDHSRIQAMVDAAVLEPAQAEGHPLSNVLLRAVGTEPRLMLDHRVLGLRPGDRILLCSDGLYRELPAAEIASILRSAPPAHAAQTLVAAAREHGGRDNISAVVIESMAAAERHGDAQHQHQSACGSCPAA